MSARAFSIKSAMILAPVVPVSVPADFDTRGVEGVGVSTLEDGRTCIAIMASNRGAIMVALDNAAFDAFCLQLAPILERMNARECLGARLTLQ